MRQATEHHKLTAMMFADMVGFSRLRQATALALRNEMLTLAGRRVADYRGRLIKTMGDGFLAEFATASDAVQCAVAMQQAVATRNQSQTKANRYRLRVGVHLGEVVETTSEEGVRDIVGEQVNLASRTEGLAAPGGICLTKHCWEQVHGDFVTPFQRLGALRVKHIPQRVEFYHRAAPDAGWAANFAHRVGVRLSGTVRLALAGLATVLALLGLLALWPLASGWLFATPQTLTSEGLRLLARYDQGDALPTALERLHRATRLPGSDASAEAALAWGLWLDFTESALDATRTEAAQHANQALQRNKDLPLGHKVLGLIALREARFAEASNHLTLATGLAARPKGEEWVALAKVHRHYQQPESVSSSLRLARQAATNDWQAWHALGGFYADQGAFIEAGEALTNAIVLAPDSPIVLRDLGALLLQTGQPQQGIELTQRSLELRPTPEACVRLGSLLHSRQQTPAAANWCLQAVELRPGDHVPQLWAALTLRDALEHPSHSTWRDRAERALSRIEARLMGRNPPPPLLLAQRGLCLALLGRAEAARADLVQAESQGSQEPGVLAYVALGYERLGDAARLAGVRAHLKRLPARPTFPPTNHDSRVPTHPIAPPQ